MSWIPIAWSMETAACLTRAVIHRVILRLLSVFVLIFSGASFSLAAPPTLRGDAAYLIDSWETEDGLPENSATAMVQSADGYLWFGTFDGLVRFDGVTFKVFNPANTPPLPRAGIVNLHLVRVFRVFRG